MNRDDPIVSGSHDDLLDELTASVTNAEQITLLCGSGVTAGAVPGTGAVVALADRYALGGTGGGGGDNGDGDRRGDGTRRAFGPGNARDLAGALRDARGRLGPGPADTEVYAAYRRVFADWLLPSTLDLMVQQVVLEAYRGPEPVASVLDPGQVVHTIDARQGRHMENDPDRWHLPAGVRALGRLLAHRGEDFGQRLLTTNVDPLIEIAVCAAGGRAVSVPVDSSGLASPEDRAPSYEGGVSVLHLQGFWRPLVRDGYRLPDPARRWLAPDRAAQRLANLITGDHVCVVGYAGWDGTILAALRRLQETRPIRVAWAAHSTDRPDGAGRLAAVGRALGQAATIYQGVDADLLFPALCERLGVPPEPVRNRRWTVRHEDWEADLVSAFR